MRTLMAVLCALIFMVLTSPETLASMTTETPASMTASEIESYDRLASFIDEKAGVWAAGWKGFVVPGLFQLQRGQILQGTIHFAIEIGAIVFLFRRTETSSNGDTFSVLSVNWVALILLAANHTFSAYDNAHWALGKNVELRLKYDVDNVILGVAF